MPVKPARRHVRPAPAKSAGPLLAVDGDSFAHRSYHALPKTIRMAGNKPAGAIVGFASVLLRLFEAEQPRAVVVGWDTLEAPTYRHKAFPAYQSGRQFDKELLAAVSAAARTRGCVRIHQCTGGRLRSR